MKLNARKMGNMKSVKDSLKKGGSNGGAAYIKNVPNDGITVRFLTEPEEWFGYYEYYDPTAKAFVPMAEGEVIPDGAKPSFRYLANVVELATDRVLPLKLAKTAANALILKYDKYDTMTDRNYELQKHGEGLDTTYDVTPEAPTRMNLTKYELLDLEAVLLAARQQATGEVLTGSAPTVTADTDDDDEDEDTKPKSKPVAKGRATPKVKFDEDKMFPDGEYRTDYTAEELATFPDDDLGGLADWWAEDGYAIDEGDLVDSILNAQESYAADEDDQADDDEASDDDEEDEDEDEDDETVYDEDSLRAMSIRELRLIAETLEVDHAKKSKNDLVDLIIEAAED